MTVWRPIPGFSRYEASSDGSIRNDRGHTMGVSRKPWGYLQTNVTDDNGKRWATGVHRLVAAAFLGPCLEGKEVCHNNGDPADNRAGNLRYDTKANNTADAIRHGRWANLNKTHCPQGHPYNEENTRISRRIGSSGRVHTMRSCRICTRARYRAWSVNRVYMYLRVVHYAIDGRTFCGRVADAVWVTDTVGETDCPMCRRTLKFRALAQAAS